MTGLLRRVGPVVVHATAQAVRHIGRRGAYLLFLALLDGVVAYSLTQPLPLGIPQRLAYQPFIELAPFWVWVWAWALVGALAAVAAVWHTAQAAAFPAAAALKMAWAAGYWVGWRDHDVLYTRGYYTTVIFAAFAMVTLLISSWRENGR